MQFVKNHIVFLIVLLFSHSIKADLRRCADFDFKININEFPYRNELEQTLSSFNETNFDQIEKLFQLLQRIETDEMSNMSYISSTKLVQYVVSL